jgi:hypothetical protein
MALACSCNFNVPGRTLNDFASHHGLRFPNSFDLNLS